MNYHPVANQIIEILSNRHCWFETFEHAAVRTSEEAAAVRTGYSLEQGAKALIVKAYNNSQDGRFVMIVVPAHLRFDSEKAQQQLATRKLRFATESEVGELTGGVLPGGVPPFGNLFNLPVYADAKLFENEKIIFNAGDRRFSVALRSDDYKTLANPTVADLT